MTSDRMLRSRLLRSGWTAVAVALVYFLAGRLGLRLAFVHESATAVWPPTGIALAAFLLLGLEIWPGVLLGAFLVNALTAGNFATSLGIATGNTLEGLAGAFLVRRYAGGVNAFERPNDIFRFALFTALAPIVSATLGVTSLALGGFAPWSQFDAIWTTWWLGDLAGALVVAPFLVLWARSRGLRWIAVRAGEAALMLLTLLACALLVFGPAPAWAVHRYPLQFLCFPALIWAAFRFTPRETSTALVLLSAVAIAGTLHGYGPFVRDEPNQSLLLLQAYLAVVSMMTLATAAAVREHNATAAETWRLKEELERRVGERTAQLEALNQELRAHALERTRAARELERSEARLREAQRIAHIGSWEWEIDRNALWWSDELYRIYGLDPATFGASYAAFLERVHPEDRDLVQEVVRRALADGRPFSFEHRIVNPDGVVLTLQARGRVVIDEGGKPIRMIGTGHDITDRKQAEEERARLTQERLARQEAEQANRLKDEFLATLSHELRTPLNAIVGWAYLLREGLDPEATARAIEIITRNAEIQKRLISDILDVSRMAFGRLDLRMQSVVLSTVIESALDAVLPKAEAKRVKLQARLEHDGPPVWGDPVRLQQVVWNLLVNGIKFASPEGYVTITLETGAGHARIRVEDDGRGIDPDFLPHVFEPFRRDSGARPHGGLGLGLGIVRHLVELHGGSVSAGNRETESGAVFVVTLPLARSDTPQTTDAFGPSPAIVLDETGNGAGESLRGVRVLVVEDDQDSRELITVLLSRCGAEVDPAGSSGEALEVLARRCPDVIVSDLEMPGEDGYDLIARIRQLPGERGGRVPAIALTAYAGQEHAVRALRAGYHAHLVKPVQLPELVATLADLIRGLGTGRS